MSNLLSHVLDKKVVRLDIGVDNVHGLKLLGNDQHFNDKKHGHIFKLQRRNLLHSFVDEIQQCSLVMLGDENVAIVVSEAPEWKTKKKKKVMTVVFEKN